MGALFGQIGVSFVSVIVMISTFGSLMGSMLASPRIFFAMADDKLLFEPIARVHPKWNTPYIAIALACVLGVGMVMTQTFEQLTDTFVLAMWPFYALSVAAIYTLRKSQPNLNRPYKVVGYPLVPAVFVAAAIYLDFTLPQFFLRMRDTVPIWNFWIGMIKAPVFGFVIAAVGCYEGLQVRGSAESVGKQTTKAVVEAIFFVIVLDALFSIIFLLAGV